MSLAYFIHKFSKLNTARKLGEMAPHKPILLLSIMQCIEYGEIWDNKIYITPILAARFKDNWHAHVQSTVYHQPKFYLPFYHLSSEGFWHLKTFPGRDIALTSSYSPKSFTSLKQVVEYAYFDEELYLLLMNNDNRIILQQTIINTYFGGQIKTSAYNLFDTVEAQILNESASEYQREILTADDEEIFIRNGVFKKVVPRIYNYTCCISGMRIVATRDIQMVDACHIIPFSETHDDTITNGLSLSPNFHRAFDRFLITINADYEVIVSDQFTESGHHSLKQFHGKKILLPRETKHQPDMINLQWHCEKYRWANYKM